MTGRNLVHCCGSGVVQRVMQSFHHSVWSWVVTSRINVLYTQQPWQFTEKGDFELGSMISGDPGGDAKANNSPWDENLSNRLSNIIYPGYGFWPPGELVNTGQNVHETGTDKPRNNENNMNVMKANVWWTEVSQWSMNMTMHLEVLALQARLCPSDDCAMHIRPEDAGHDKLPGRNARCGNKCRVSKMVWWWWSGMNDLGELGEILQRMFP